MTNIQSPIYNLQLLLSADTELQRLAMQSLRQAAQANPDVRTNPVRTLEDWYTYMEHFLHRLPWQTMDLGEDASFFHRIDQNIGYFYYLIDQPLDALKNRGYWYPSLQYEPRIAQWLVEYNKAWGEWLSGEESWNDTYYHLARTDSRFELATDRYESPDNWHSWNDFFTRRLKTNLQSKICNLKSKFISPCDGVIKDYPVKTISTNHLQDLLGDSPYAKRFEGGKAIHIVLDVYDYHRFHAPCDGIAVVCRIIPGIHAGGGVIIWDESQHRYRYDQVGATGFQSLETRGVVVLDTPDFGYIALIAVGIQQVSSVVWSSNLKSIIENQKSATPIHPTPGTSSRKTGGVASAEKGIALINQSPISFRVGDEIGSFKFGGSDIILLFEPGKAPAFELGKTVKVGDIMA